MHPPDSNNAAIAPPRPLVVDLDGTLVATDTLHEQLLHIAGHRASALPEALAALTRGKTRFKTVVARHAQLDPAALPYRSDVMRLIESARGQGRPIVLASASHRSTVQAVADHLNVFDAVIASSDTANLKGASKLAAIRDLLNERGWGDRFDYIGDSPADLPIWERAQTAYLVDAKPATRRRAHAIKEVNVLVPRRGLAQCTQGLVKATRPHQWSKNLLLAVPLLMAQAAGDVDAWLSVLIAFFAFGLCASAVYLVNDLMDLRADRLHPTKRTRPMAAGVVPVSVAARIAPLLAAVAIAGSALLLPTGFLWPLLVYTASAWLYSLTIKHRAIIDVVWLGCLYTLRVIAGGEATATPASPWLLALALFLFLSIALAKRYAELRLLADEGRDTATGRAYRVDDQSMLSVMGIGAGMLSVLVFALYINSKREPGPDNPSIVLYEHPEVLWVVCPIMLYWIGRLWMRAHRRQMRDDPLIFALTDRVSYIVALLIILAAVIAA